jgi:hypothetical protein
MPVVGPIQPEDRNLLQWSVEQLLDFHHAAALT